MNLDPLRHRELITTSGTYDLMQGSDQQRALGAIAVQPSALSGDGRS